MKSDIKELKVSQNDAKYLGTEPKFDKQPSESEYQFAVIKALNWYNYFFTNKESKELLLQYLEHNGRDKDAKRFRKVSDSIVYPTTGFMARMSLRGLTLSEQHKSGLDVEINRLMDTVAVDTTDEEKPNRPNVQEIMRDRTLEAGGELEGYFDEFFTNGYPKDFESKVVEELSKRNILPQHVPMLVKAWQDRLDEYNELLKGKDKDLVEGYNNLGKTQIKNAIKYCEQIISDLNAYVSVKKTNKAPRAKKAVPPEKRVSKLKYLKTYKDTKTKLELNSVNPVKLIGASEAWVYDTAKRKLHHFIADSYSKEFTVKGNLLLGFDTKESETKTLRKPETQIKEIMGSKPAARKFFKDIKALATTPKGRFNENMIILKAF